MTPSSRTMSPNRITKQASGATLLLGLFVLTTLAACGGVEPPEFASQLVPVGGQIKLKGEPLVGATVQFLPTDTTPGAAAATGYTDAEGKYRVVTTIPGVDLRETVGAVPGQYHVLVSKIAMPDGSPIPTEMGEADALEAGAVNTISSRYNDPANTPLKAEVPAGGSQELNFDL